MNKDISLKFRLQEARMFDNAIQRYWKLVVETLYHILLWLAVEQSVRRQVQQDAVDGICRLFDVWRRVLHVGGHYFWSLKQCDCYKNVFFVVNSNVSTNYWLTQVLLSLKPSSGLQLLLNVISIVSLISISSEESHNKMAETSAKKNWMWRHPISLESYDKGCVWSKW